MPAARCALCLSRVPEGEEITPDDQSFHKECFKCLKCSKDLSLDDYIITDLGPFCQGCKKLAPVRVSGISEIVEIVADISRVAGMFSPHPFCPVCVCLLIAIFDPDS